MLNHSLTDHGAAQAPAGLRRVTIEQRSWQEGPHLGLATQVVVSPSLKCQTRRSLSWFTVLFITLVVAKIQHAKFPPEI